MSFTVSANDRACLWAQQCMNENILSPENAAKNQLVCGNKLENERNISSLLVQHTAHRAYALSSIFFGVVSIPASFFIVSVPMACIFSAGVVAFTIYHVFTTTELLTQVRELRNKNFNVVTTNQFEVKRSLIALLESPNKSSSLVNDANLISWMNALHNHFVKPDGTCKYVPNSIDAQLHAAVKAFLPYSE